MDERAGPLQAERNVRLYPWFKAFQSMLFWQAVWFLFFQARLSAAEAILLYAVFDIATTAFEVPSGYLSDRIGRRPTLIAAGIAGVIGSALLAVGDGFVLFAVAQVLLGAAQAFASGTDNAMLFESLTRAGRAKDIETEEIRAWRFGFVALAVSAVAGGVFSVIDPRLPFAATTLAMCGMLALALLFREPDRADPAVSGQIRLQSLLGAFRMPVVRWLFVLSLSMYAFSHVPFVFGQPFIQQALEPVGLASEAPLASGVLTALMMAISVLASLFASRLRQTLGLPGIVLSAFAIQIALIAVLAVSASLLAALVLLLRMVPNAMSGPFVIARLQPLLGDEVRATYLSGQSLAGRLVMSVSLFLASGATSAQGAMTRAEISAILGWFALAGVLVLTGLALSARRSGIEG